MEVLKKLLKGENRGEYTKGREGHLPMLFSGFTLMRTEKRGRGEENIYLPLLR